MKAQCSFLCPFLQSFISTIFYPLFLFAFNLSYMLHEDLSRKRVDFKGFKTRITQIYNN